MKISMAWLAVLVLVAASAGADEFAVYKWVNEDGIPQYTDRPPSNSGAESTGIRSQRTNPDAVMARSERQSEQFDTQRRARNDANVEAAESAAQREQNLAERRANCERAKERAKSYSTAQRLYRPLPDGGREYLSDQELTDARAQAETAISTWCD